MLIELCPALSSMSMPQVLAHVYRGSGIQGLFQGLIPRMGTNVWLTLFMVSGANIVKRMRESSQQMTAQQLEWHAYEKRRFLANLAQDALLS